MSLYIPRLRRAVSDYLQLPLRESAVSLEIISEYLYDLRTLDSVYKLLISESSKEPCSPYLIGKSVTFFRRHLSKFRPSHDVLILISNFLKDMARVIGSKFTTKNELFIAIRFLNTIVNHALQEAAITLDHQTTFEANNLNILKPWASLPQPSANTDNDESEIEKGFIHKIQSQGLMITNTGSNYGSEPQISKKSSKSLLQYTPGGTPAKKNGSTNKFQNMLGSAFVTTDLPLHNEHQIGSGLIEHVSQEMLNFRPPLIWMSKDSQDPDINGWRNTLGIRGIICSEHLWRAVKSQNEDQPLGDRRESMSLIGCGPLFQYRSYLDQDPLKLTSEDIGALVEAICGKGAARVGLDEEGFWGEAIKDMWLMEGSTSKSLGQACTSILIKLVIDMYIELGPNVSYVLTLNMLSKSLKDPDPNIRSRVFDIIYNLSHHSNMFSDISKEAELVSSTQDNFQTKLQTLKEEPDNFSRNSDADDISLTSKSPAKMPLEKDYGVEFFSWLRILLFDTLIYLTQSGDNNTTVWRSALGCFLHLTTSGGAFQWDRLEKLPIHVIKKFLRICIQDKWSDELYYHFLQLPIHLLYTSDTNQAAEGTRSVDEKRLEMFGGTSEILLHLRCTRSNESAAGLIRIIFEYAAAKVGCGQETITALFISTMCAVPSLRVLLNVCHRGSAGIPQNLMISIRSFLNDCADISHDSPKKPSHARFNSQYSMFSSDTANSFIADLMTPEVVDSLMAILKKVDELLRSAYMITMDPIIESEKMSDSDWELLREQVASAEEPERISGLEKLACLLETKADDLMQGKAAENMSLLPYPSRENTGNNTNDFFNHISDVFMCWLTKSSVKNAIGFEFSSFINCLMACLCASQTAQPSSHIENNSLPSIGKLCKIFYKTLDASLSWVSLMPQYEQKEPLLNIVHQVFQFVHVPNASSTDISNSPTLNNIAPEPLTFLPWEFIRGTGAVYLRLLRMAPIDLLVNLVDSLKKHCPAHLSPVHPNSPAHVLGFNGRPGHRFRTKAMGYNMPWTDTPSDMRAALCLLLLHRCNIDPRSSDKLAATCSYLLKDSDVRVQYFASRHMLTHLMGQRAEECREALREFVAEAQEINDEHLVDNPFLQVRHILSTGLINIDSH